MKFAFFLLVCALALPAQERFAGSPELDEAIEEAIKNDQIPGAVLIVGQPGKILHRKAYGSRALMPAREPMALDTIFDVASLTKIVATTSAVMALFEDGKIRLADKVTDYLPDYQGGKSDATIRQLLVHFSGLRPDVDLKPKWSGYDTGIRLALIDRPVAEPGQRFIYSDINFVLLGEIVRKVSGKPLDQFVAERVFQPLGMKDTRFNPPPALRKRIAPTERVEGQILRGIVHDPTARYMGGVAGHAGLFSTAADLSRWAEMMLESGQRNGGPRIFSPLTVRKFTEPNTPPHQPILRGLGFDIDSPFSSNRGELFPVGSFGHTGFTGTSLWMDPVTNTYVVLLSNSVHPRLRRAISPLRARVATIAAAALGVEAQDVLLTSYLETAQGTPPRRMIARTVKVMTGIDVLEAEGFARLKGRRAGLITNHTGRTRDGRRNIDAMLAGGVNLTALFSPEHGLLGTEDHENVGHGKDEASGLTVWSLYQGKDRKPSPAMLNEIDVLVFDIQDIGARFYTYSSTMKNAMEAAAAANKDFIVLDRPNPINGVHVEGPMVDEDLITFVACTVMPLRHGMTLGELARMINTEDKVGARLEVIQMKDWLRGDWWDATGLTWVDPSPSMRSLNAALLYPGLALIEYSRNWSVGRGTDAPFEQVGADWISGVELAAELNRRQVPGVRAYPTRFTPQSSNFEGKTIEGVRFVVTDREGLSGIRLGLELIGAINRLYPGQIDLDRNIRLIGSRELVEQLKAGVDPRFLEPALAEKLAGFLEKRRKYLLYR
ncbi:MAG: DUF1343 domain-containing protein [Bryobacteraceae bacterium]|nr:DUF1343 domain-containing protein [Bryobacteraceae bacterium]